MGCRKIACLLVSLLPGFLLILLEFGREEEGQGRRGKTFLHCGRQDTVKSSCLYRKPDQLGQPRQNHNQATFLHLKGLNFFCNKKLDLLVKPRHS